MDEYQIRRYEKSFSHSELGVDLGRGICYDNQQITDYDLLEMSLYYQQSMTTHLTYLLMAKTEDISLSTKDSTFQGVFTKNKAGEINFDVTFINPTFIVRNGNEPFRVTLNGRISLNYTFEFEKGFTLNKIDYSNTILKNLINSPPQTTSPEYFAQLAKKCGKPFTPPKLPENKPIAERLVEFTGKEKFTSEKRKPERIRLADKFTPEEMEKFEQYQQVPLISQTLISPVSYSVGELSKQKNVMAFTVTFKNPTFIFANGESKEIPGTMTTEYEFNKKKGFEPKKATFSNDILLGIVTHPLKKPDTQDIERFHQAALQSETARNNLTATPSTPPSPKHPSHD